MIQHQNDIDLPLVLTGTMGEDEIDTEIHRHLLMPTDRMELLNLVLEDCVVRKLIHLMLEKLAKHSFQWDLLLISDCAANRSLSKLVSFIQTKRIFQRLEMRCELGMSRLCMSVPTTNIHKDLRALSIAGLHLSMEQAVTLRSSLVESDTLELLCLNRLKLEQFAVCQIADGIAKNRSLRQVEYHWLYRVEAYLVLHSATSKHPSIQDITITGDTGHERICHFLATGRCSCLRRLGVHTMGNVDLSPLISVPSKLSRGLQCLDLSDNVFHNFQIDELFMGLSHFPNLVDLKLTNITLSDFGAALLQGADVISSSVQKMDLSRNELTDNVADEFLVNLWKFPGLQYLNMSFNRLNKLEFTEFLANPNCFALKEIHFCHPHFSWLLHKQDHIVWFEQLLRNTNLKLGTFWACKNVSLQCLLDCRQSWIEDVEDTPDGLWPVILARINATIPETDSRLQTNLFRIVREQAIGALALTSSDMEKRSDSSEKEVPQLVEPVSRSVEKNDFCPMHCSETVTTGGASSEFMTIVSYAHSEAVPEIPPVYGSRRPMIKRIFGFFRRRRLIRQRRPNTA